MVTHVQRFEEFSVAVLGDDVAAREPSPEVVYSPESYRREFHRDKGIKGIIFWAASTLGFGFWISALVFKFQISNFKFEKHEIADGAISIFSSLHPLHPCEKIS